jgi:ubiquinone/menaquinone biosynthesis C-methylase UbiE
MHSPDQNPDRWSSIAPDYERAFEPLTSQLATHLLNLLEMKPGERVVDVAAGTGAFSLAAARRGIQALAIDFAPGMVARLQERIAASGFQHISAEVMDGQSLALADASFDAGVSILGLMFFPDIRKGLRELRRVVRPGKQVAIVSWSDIQKLQPYLFLTRAIERALPGFQPPATPPVWMRLAGAKLLALEMQEAGLKRIQTTTAVFSFPVGSPEAFWSNFTASAPPLVHLFQHMSPESKAAVGGAFLDLLTSGQGDGALVLSAEVCIGIGQP